MAASRSSRPARRRVAAAFVLLVSALALGHEARASDGRLRYQSGTSVPLTLAATAVWIGTEYPLKRTLAPDTCRWCDRHEDGRENLNALDAAVRRRVRWDDPEPPRVASDVLLFAGVPAVALGGMWLAARHDGREDEFGENAVMMFEAVAVSMTLNQASKFLLARQRPYVHFHPPGTPLPYDTDDNLSFYSGHAAVTFSVSTAAGTIASLRGYRRSAAAWVPGFLLAATTGYLRLACDRHYFTDVLAGTVIGTAVGIGVPRLFHGREDEDAAGESASARPAPIVVMSWRW